ncbi:helix-turn-helix domain-containing protein [Pectinatus sottacetonis]|uniref:helix-turn-helix domain-containing protein n=1 Tax=Pectinatus sottacetonis TaxID=1002795 RepID=UPI0018C64DE4|nr:helix-turn-helix transcriptional regulator [Pectinatus sottacetonis]
MLGKRLRNLRIKKNISQKELADLVGVNRTTIGKYELKNVRPAYEILEKICRILNTTPEYLSGFDKKYSSPETKPKELLSFIKEENYTLYGKIVSDKDKERLSKLIELLYCYNDDKNKKTKNPKKKHNLDK